MSAHKLEYPDPDAISIRMRNDDIRSKTRTGSCLFLVMYVLLFIFFGSAVYSSYGEFWVLLLLPVGPILYVLFKTDYYKKGHEIRFDRAKGVVLIANQEYCTFDEIEKFKLLYEESLPDEADTQLLLVLKDNGSKTLLIGMLYDYQYFFETAKSLSAFLGIPLERSARPPESWK